MANRRCIQSLTLHLTYLLSSNPSSLHSLTSTSPQTLTPALLNSLNTLTPSPECPHVNTKILSFHRHFCSNRPISSDDDEGNEEETDYDDDHDEEGLESNIEPSREYTPEEKEHETAEIGYKVIGPLQKSDRVFKPYEPVFAVVQIGSHQFKVSNGDSIFTEKLKFCEVNGKLILNKVLLLDSKTQTIIGRPTLPDAAVHAVVEEHALDAKVLIFKKKRRKNYRRTRGHRQVRGSIPLLWWEQIVDLSYKPRLNVIYHEETPKVVERHFHDLLQRYGDVIAVDLTNKSRRILRSTGKNKSRTTVTLFARKRCFYLTMLNLRDTFFYPLKFTIQLSRCFLIDTEEKILAEQRGVIRSNCIDCLDRTNVTQSYLAQKSLNSQLQRLGALSSNECISMFSEDFEIFRTMWVDQGDEISLEYSGTHALKRDLVRYGKQTMTGLIQDGMSALSRYFLNNFQDGVRQDRIDLISGRYSVNRGSPSRVQHNGLESLSYLPSNRDHHYDKPSGNTNTYLSSVLCAGVTAGVMSIVKANGRQICSRPRLCGLL